MTYGLGIDVGTSFTAAALGNGTHAEMLPLSDVSLVTPSVVFADPDGVLLTGEAAARRAEREPARAVREFKRRLGDPTPIVLGGREYSPPELIAALVRDVVDTARQVTGGRDPDAVVLTCPAIWGPYRLEQFAEVSALAEVEHCRVVTEPEAAAAFYLPGRSPAVGRLVAVYDLGGTTFDTAVLRSTGDGWELLGDPEGVDGTGGVDFDLAVLGLLDERLGGAVSRLDRTRPEQAAALTRLRQDAVRLKESLSTETETTLSVLLPDGPSEVRLTRAEFEDRISPVLEPTIEAMHRALASAGLSPSMLDTILLSGGSSRIPLVARRLAKEFARPVRTVAQPEHVVATGAAALAHADAAARADEPGRTVGAGGATTPGRRPDRGGRGGSARPVIAAAAALLTVLSVGTIWFGVAAPDSPDDPAISASSPRPAADTGTSAGAHLTDVLPEVGDRPQGVAVSPDGTRLWVPSLLSGEVRVIDTTTGETQEVITTPQPPQYVVVAPDGARAFVTTMAEGVTNSLLAYDTRTFTLLATIAVGRTPFPPSISLDGRVLWVPDHSGPSIVVVDPVALRSYGVIDVDPAPRGVAFMPDGRTGFAVAYESGVVDVLDVTQARVVDRFPVGPGPVAVALSRDGAIGATADFDAGTVSLFDTVSHEVVATVPVGLRPRSLAFGADGRYLYLVTEGDDTFTVLDTVTHTVVQTVVVGQQPWSVTVDRRGEHAWVSNATDDTVTVLSLN
ncbi:Hsp70 family protein [Solwaraspora sp. WMMB335]|uniref:Hsp70 family protein n=1 Tax=Solwaraspora sp. WMMB335 TaxID=3404118 RepID=UPI003B95F667